MGEGGDEVGVSRKIHSGTRWLCGEARCGHGGAKFKVDFDTSRFTSRPLSWHFGAEFESGFASFRGKKECCTASVQNKYTFWLHSIFVIPILRLRYSMCCGSHTLDIVHTPKMILSCRVLHRQCRNRSWRYYGVWTQETSRASGFHVPSSQ